MKSTFVLAQMAAEERPEINLKKAAVAAARAREEYRADAVIFPELFMSYFRAGLAPEEARATAQTLEGPFVAGMRSLAHRYGLWLFFGMNERVEDSADVRNYNTVVAVNERGEIAARYRKTHMYDAFHYRESEFCKPGEQLFEPIDTPFGRIGLFACYEVRFPEIARYERARGADILIVPSAWAVGKLKSRQFRTLVTARALENTTYVLACNQCGRSSTGESLAVDPMGVAVASAAEEEVLLPVTICPERIREVRTKLPSYEERRPELYR